MTVSASDSRIDHNGDGSTTAFPVDFYFLDDTHLLVIVTAANGIATTQVLDTDYTVTGAGDEDGGSVVFGTAPASGTRVSILRAVPLTQETDYQPNDPFPAETHEQALDKLTMIAQQHEEALGRALTLAPNASGIAAQLPSAEAGKVVGWNASGTGLANYSAADLATDIIGTNMIVDEFTGTGSTVEFTLSVDPQTINNTWVFLSGVYQAKSEYSVTGTTLTFDVAPPNDVKIEVVQQVAVTYPVTSIAPGTINTAALADNAVTTAKINNGAITLAKLNSDVFGTTTGKVLQFAEDNKLPAVDGSELTNLPIPEADASIRQTVFFETGAFASGSTIIPQDDTIPQITEGTQFMSLAITPTASDSILEIEVLANLDNQSGTYGMIGALFKDSGADAVAVGRTNSYFSSGAQLFMKHRRVAGSTSAQTYTFRAGTPSAITVAFNGYTGRLMGGKMASYIKITEYAP